uniref:Uncharacterized protein n=1 Tax=Candidatus Kentrum sp. FM TaxID=2126340 RepID=A0A450VPU5_9GAMM|nr:MAG: hypothetical protein BECKFM1743A_GA0114220_100264 [Candidatus Kentron sp. FM]VFJ45632.1 MAG: hypothetical protein BECKFM1743C_GA0114222_100284 [Candidatus Kentron sp. FM]VFK06802.1 MAG: hypothetical protein BECKFM1743B_GA0114221_100253 [Candidatus Kentron sp. FM]
MATSNQLQFTNYQKLSSGYRQWLTAIGAVNTAVLALTVLILTKGGITVAGSEQYATLISALFIGIFSCFIGSLLMGEAEAVRGDKEAFHLFMIASVNIHVAVILFFLSTMLLATVHRNLLGGNNVPAVIFSMLFFIGLASLLWMGSTISAAWKRIEKPPVSGKKPFLLLTIGTAVIGIIYYLIAKGLHGVTSFPIPFTLCALSSVISLIIFVFVLEIAMAKEQASGWVLWVAPAYIMIYAVGVFLPLVSVMWLAWGTI